MPHSDLLSFRSINILSKNIAESYDRNFNLKILNFSRPGNTLTTVDRLPYVLKCLCEDLSMCESKRQAEI